MRIPNLGGCLWDVLCLAEAVAQRHNLGSAYYRLGRSDDAIVHFERALEINQKCTHKKFVEDPKQAFPGNGQRFIDLVLISVTNSSVNRRHLLFGLERVSVQPKPAAADQIIYSSAF